MHRQILDTLTPSKQELRRLCLEIQKRWTPQEPRVEVSWE